MQTNQLRKLASTYTHKFIPIINFQIFDKDFCNYLFSKPNFETPCCHTHTSSLYSKGHNWPWKKTKKAEIFSRLACATTEYVRGFSRVQSTILRAAVRYVVVRGSTMVRLVENHPSSDSFCLSWLFSTFNELKGISNYLSSYYQTFHLKKHMHENRKVYSILLY